MNYDVARAMQFYGGSFTKALVTAWYCADPRNRAKLEAAFPHLIAKYEQISKDPKLQLGDQPEGEK